MTLKRLIENNTAIIFLETKEYHRANKLIKEIAGNNNKAVFLWDSVDKLNPNEGEENPLIFIREQYNTILVMGDIYKDIDNIETMRSLINTLPTSLAQCNTIIVISPTANVPSDISPYVTLHKLPLPTKEDFMEITTESIAEAGLGLTQYEFKEALNAGENNMFEVKKQIIEKNSSLRVYDSTDNFDTLCGMDTMKNFVKKMVLSGKGKGVLILGIPGGGKSEFAKRLGNETKRITVNLDFGNMMGSYVGQTEQNTSDAFNVINSINQSIVFIDEIEKGLAGVSEGGGVSKRQGGQFLKWMQDKNSDTYVVATANDINSLPSEYLRSGRWDGIFFIDMPDTETKQAILNIYKNKYNILDDINVVNLSYTGAEIETLCRLASNLEISLEEAQEYVCPIINTNQKSIKHLRDFAKTRAIPANKNENTIKNGREL